MSKPESFKKPMLWALAAFFVAAFIYSCKKEFNAGADVAATPQVSAAKQWYQQTYQTKSVSQYKANSTGAEPKLNELLQPYWDAARQYVRNGDEVVETPITDSTRIALGIKNEAGGRPYKKEQSKTSFLILKQADGYHAYIMTILADSAYLNGDYTKLQKNSYNKRDENFSGLVVYYTPDGKAAGRYKYKNGQQVLSSSQTGTKTANAVKVNTEQCLDWYWCVWDEHGTLLSEQYVYTTCSEVGGPAGDGEPGKVCFVNNGYNDLNKRVNTFNDEPPACPTNDCDGGMPPPQDDPCAANSATAVINNIKDPCLRMMVNNAINADVKYNVNETMMSIFNVNTDFNLKFRDANASDPAFGDPYASGATNVVSSAMKTQADRTLLLAMDLEISFNLDQVSNASKEYVAATIMHEAIHAYLRYSQTIVNQHYDMAQNYVVSMTAQLRKMFPNLSEDNARALSWSGLEKEGGQYYNSFSNLEKQSMIDINDNFKKGRSGSLCTR